MKKSLILLITLFVSIQALPAQQDQDVFVPISKYIQNGDSERLSAWFAPNLEVDVLGISNVCSRQQAKQILKEFFNEYSPKVFTIAYKSGKASMKYAIGNLNAGGNKFRVTLFVRIQKEGNYIQQLRIEKE
ncbi:MAG: DUF4783 domain-containing protein [Bacteroidales bacterium]|nr:DUF4783 domain-containing protein [Bacteroidales bacterium]MDD4656929.1 DUF4783 domain-containing protein [Bacteroidales bacterium]